MKALVIGIGGLRGAYDAGVVATLCRELGSHYFDAIYMSSVGVFAGTFYAANQPDVIENTWRNYVSGSQLVNYLNPLRGKNVLDTEYLTEIFQNDKSLLDVDAALNSDTGLWYVLENLETTKSEYIQPNRSNIFDLMRAATAVPLVHKPVELNGIEYIDAGLVDPLPIEKAISDGCRDITVIYNKPREFYVGRGYKMGLAVISRIVQPQLRNQFLALEEKYRKLNKYMDSLDNISVIRPQVDIPYSILATDKKVINDLVDLGIQDAREYLKNSHLA